MNNALRKLAFFVGVGLLILSIYWSQDGFNFDVAGDSGYGTTAIAVGWFLALSVTVMQFIFSSSFKELNPSLILFGVVAYAYSIYTNYQGVLHFQGLAQNNMTAWVLALILDAVPEPMIAWSLYESLTGDLVGNLIKSIISAPGKIQAENRSYNAPKSMQKPQFRPVNSKKSSVSPEFLGKLSQKSGERENLHRVNSETEIPSRFNL